MAVCYSIRKSNFYSNDTSESITIKFYTNSLDFDENEIHNNLSFWSSRLTNKVKIRNNRFYKPVDISRIEFPEFNNYIPYNQFMEGLGIEFLDSNRYSFNTGRYEDMGDEETFDYLINSYQFLYNNYRQRGDLKSANAAFVKIKDIMLNEARFLYHQEKTFTHWVRYRLGQIMRMYTDHGTNPAKAIVISIYIILAFSIFYFFFPSEWDKQSKTKLIQDYRLFIKKNDHGYVKPFFAMMTGLGFSLINALTLSLNAFVTLGFGTIPARGLARYVCVLQGFIGWFLLSIFIVALINQVLS